ncbi:hypothetical protein FKP32DRAFT_1563037 [Trametes sanguinea]|nr:hypothetical protein FKP32DRAFT_1563037 [Trametes sanguinea]
MTLSTPSSPSTPIEPVHDITLNANEADYITPDVISRIASIINYSEPESCRYPIGLLPQEAAWGVAGDGNGLDKFLCLNDRPVAVWLVGVVTSLWLTPSEGNRVSIGVRLLSTRDHVTARRVQFLGCCPQADPSVAGLSTTAGKYLSQPDGGGSVSFSEVYDARPKLKAWSIMDKIDPSRVQKTDVVVVECYIKRFKMRDGNNRYGWKTWTVGFELLRIAQLLVGPGPADLVPEDSSVDL